MTPTESPPPVPVVTKDDFSSFYRREYRAMVALAAATSGEFSMAEDIAQEAMVRVQKVWSKVSDYDKPGAYLRRVTINLSISTRQRRSIEAQATKRAAAVSQTSTLDPSSENAHVWKAVAKLPVKQRGAIALKYLEDQSVAQIAEVLECSESTAKVHLHRGRKKLQELLEGSQ